MDRMHSESLVAGRCPRLDISQEKEVSKSALSKNKEECATGYLEIL